MLSYTVNAISNPLPQPFPHILINTNMSQELTYAEVSKHSSKKDLYVVIHDKVYDTSSFVDEHP